MIHIILMLDLQQGMPANHLLRKRIIKIFLADRENWAESIIFYCI